VRTVRNRGKYMQEAVPVGVGAMAAILSLPIDQVRAVCEEAAQGEVCQPANINSPDQIVISGNKAAVERALKAADSGPKIPRSREARLALLRRGLIPWPMFLRRPARSLSSRCTRRFYANGACCKAGSPKTRRSLG
jgi:hypothetical protein